ncbi:hypothetical protein ABZY19_39110 [Streptomyces sp. NPDC006475]|uniref:hypothetical protein n=1 Tax=Streptomyces sp. NPDC006475 TaxID=3155719 RepID=UPI0033BBD8F9
MGSDDVAPPARGRRMKGAGHVWPRKRSQRPPQRLQPELDDLPLIRALTHLEAQIAAQGNNLAECNDRGSLAYPIEQALRDPGEDWDRRMHRLLVFSTLPDAHVLARQWRAWNPASADAMLLQAFAGLARARAGSDSSDLGATFSLCWDAAELAPADPAPWIGLLSYYRLLRAPWVQVHPLWMAVKTRDPWNREAHWQMLDYISPEECGSNVLTVQFTDSVVVSEPAGSSVAALSLTASLNRYRRALAAGGLTALTAHRHWDQPHERAIIDNALATWIQPGFLSHAAALADLNLLAYVLTKAARVRDAWPVFEATAAIATSWPWELDGDPLEQVREWHSRALRTRNQR